MGFINPEDYKKIFAFHQSIQNRIISRESGSIEFKESFNWLAKDKYAKSIAAFANNKGGYLVFGIKDQPRALIGLPSTNFENTDEAKITSYLNSILSPEVEYEKFIVEVKGKQVGIIQIFQSKNKPLICIKNDGDLRESDIYYRYNAKNEKIKYPELKSLLEGIREDERKAWMSHIEKISKIGPVNAGVLDTIKGEISGQGGSLIIDKRLVPKLKFIKEGSFNESGKPVLKLIGDVRPVSVNVSRSHSGNVQVTDDPNAPVVRLEEKDILKKYPLDYDALTKNLLSRYSDFKRNSKYHSLRKKFKREKRLTVCCEFCCKHRGLQEGSTIVCCFSH